MSEHWIILSPHFDDAALSLGGWIWQQVQRGRMVEIWTILGSQRPPGKPLTPFARQLHATWQLGDEVPRLRAAEDVASCKALGATWHHFDLPDCIYRTYPDSGEAVVQKEEALFSSPIPSESYLVSTIHELLKTHLPVEAEIAIPLSIGSHRDHVLTRMAAERCGISLWHYADYPYVIQENVHPSNWIPENAEPMNETISPSGIQAWQDSIICHHSQLALFWKTENEMHQAIESYSRKHTWLWKFYQPLNP